MLRVAILIQIILASLSVGADNSQATLSFKQWKQKEETEAQNRVVRLSNTLLLLKSERYSVKNILPEIAAASKEESPYSEEGQQELISGTEAKLKEAVEQLEFTKELTINNYFSVYLNHFRDEPEALKSVASSMNETEVVELLKALLNRNRTEESVLPLREEASIVSEAPKKKDPTKL